MKLIQLTQGMYTIVNDRDFEYLNQWKWNAKRGNNTFYAVRFEEKRAIYMHRELTNAPRGMEVDHINGNGLLNTRSNLRICTHAENTRNKRMHRDNRAGYKGVYLDRGKYHAQIRVNGKQIYLGRFPTPELGAIAYDKAAEQYFGEFARTNAMRGG